MPKKRDIGKDALEIIEILVRKDIALHFNVIYLP